MKNGLTLILALLLAITIVALMFYNFEISSLRKQISSQENELGALKTANLTATISVHEISWTERSSNVWITGYVFNSGGSIAFDAGLKVIAFNEIRKVLINMTVPLVWGGIFTSNESKNLIPDNVKTTPLEFGNLFSKQNVTVGLMIYHEGIFPNSTIFEVTPIWKNAP